MSRIARPASIVVALVIALVAGATSVMPVVAAEPQTIAFTLPTYVFGRTRAVPLALPATASSGLPIAYAVETPLTCSVTGRTLLPLAAGTCTVTASQAGDDTWGPAAPVTRSMEVLTTALRVRFDQGFIVNGETRLSIPLVVPAGTLVTMTVTTDRPQMANKTIEVWARYSPTSRWRRIRYRSIDTETLTGTFRFYARPWAQYRWRFGGKGILHDAWSQTRTVIGG